jgi:hypothetical protein
MNKQLENQLRNDFKLAVLQAKSLLKYQQGKHSYNEFIDDVVEYGNKMNHSNELTSFNYREWLSYNNPLPNNSSGSTFTALLDIDNLLVPYEGKYEDDDYDEIEALYNEIVRPLINEERTSK